MPWVIKVCVAWQGMGEPMQAAWCSWEEVQSISSYHF